jgi:hypothetical protein
MRHGAFGALSGTFTFNNGDTSGGLHSAYRPAHAISNRLELL